MMSCMLEHMNRFSNPFAIFDMLLDRKCYYRQPQDGSQGGFPCKIHETLAFDSISHCIPYTHIYTAAKCMESKTITWKEDNVVLRIMGGGFSVSLPDQSGAGQAKWPPGICPHGPRTFSGSLTSLKTSRHMAQTDSWSSLPQAHVGTRVPKPSALIFDDESRVSLYHSDRHVREFHLFCGCSNSLVFQQHDDNLGHAYSRCRGWLWTHQQIVNEISADDSSCSACVPTWGGTGNG